MFSWFLRFEMDPIFTTKSQRVEVRRSHQSLREAAAGAVETLRYTDTDRSGRWTFLSCPLCHRCPTSTHIETHNRTSPFAFGPLPFRSQGDTTPRHGLGGSESTFRSEPCDYRQQNIPRTSNSFSRLLRQDLARPYDGRRKRVASSWEK